MIFIEGRRIISVEEAMQFRMDGLITKRAYKKVRNYFEALARRERRHPVEPPDEDVWDNPGITPTVSPKTTNDTPDAIPF